MLGNVKVIEEPAPAIRAKTGRFLPGQSGNPRGRPAETQETREGKKLLRDAAPSACKLLCDTINDSGAKLELRIRCCEIVLDRVYGKPQQSVELDSMSTPQIIFVGGDRIAE